MGCLRVGGIFAYTRVFKGLLRELHYWTDFHSTVALRKFCRRYRPGSKEMAAISLSVERFVMCSSDVV